MAKRCLAKFVSCVCIRAPALAHSTSPRRRAYALATKRLPGISSADRFDIAPFATIALKVSATFVIQTLVLSQFDRVTQNSAGAVCHTSYWQISANNLAAQRGAIVQQTLLRGLTHTGHLKHFLADQIPKVALLLVQYLDLVMVDLDAGLD